MRLVGILIILVALAGCASGVGGTSCTNLISGAGGLLQFCQAGQKIAITERGIGDAAAAIVDDPSTLAALADHLKLNADFKHSRKLVARACVVQGSTYVSVKSSDLDRLLHKNRLDQNERSF